MTTKTTTMEMPESRIEWIYDYDKSTLTRIEHVEEDKDIGIQPIPSVKRLCPEINDFIFWMFYQLEDAESLLNSYKESR